MILKIWYKSQIVSKVLRQTSLTSFWQTENAVSWNLQQTKQKQGHHKLIYTFLKSTYAVGKPLFSYYIDTFKNFNRELFKKNRSKNLKNSNSFEVFYEGSGALWNR